MVQPPVADPQAGATTRPSADLNAEASVQSAADRVALNPGDVLVRSAGDLTMPKQEDLLDPPKDLCHRWHLHQSRGRLGAWVSRGNQPLAMIIGSASTYLLLWLMTLVPVIVCRHLPPLAPSVDVPVTSTYVCVFWTLLPPSV